MRKFVALTVISLLAASVMNVPATRAQTPVTFVRRAEAVMILLKNGGVRIDLDTKSYGAYPDILDGEWYVPYMMKGIELGLITPNQSTGLAEPHRSVSRAEFLMMMTKVFGLTTNIPYQFTDINMDEWYTSYIGLAWRYKLFGSANNPDLLQPELKVTHQEAAFAIYGLMKAEPSLQPVPGLFTVRNAPMLSSTPRIQPAPAVSPLKIVTKSIEKKSKNIIANFVSRSTPQSIKSAMLKFIRNRGSRAQLTRIEIIQAINNVRASYNLSPLRSNYYLELSAQRHAKDMAGRGYFSHFTPEGLSYVDRIKSAGYLDVNPDSCSCAQQFDLSVQPIERGPNYVITGNEECSCEPIFSLGENLARGQLTVLQVMTDWLNSENHRRNMLRPEFEEIGIGLFGDVWVQNFGRLAFE